MPPLCTVESFESHGSIQTLSRTLSDPRKCAWQALGHPAQLAKVDPRLLFSMTSTKKDPKLTNGAKRTFQTLLARQRPFWVVHSKTKRMLFQLSSSDEPLRLGGRHRNRNKSILLRRQRCPTLGTTQLLAHLSSDVSTRMMSVPFRLGPNGGMEGWRHVDWLLREKQTRFVKFAIFAFEVVLIRTETSASSLDRRGPKRALQAKRGRFVEIARAFGP